MIISSDPLTSVYTERLDSPLIQRLVDIHWYGRQGKGWDGKPPVIVDVTWGKKGGFWKGSDEAVIGMDLDRDRVPSGGVHAHSSYLPFREGSIDILAYDPPHIPDNGKERPKYMAEGYTIAWGENDINGATRDLVGEAAVVLAPGGVIIAKISNQIQRNMKRWQVPAFMASCEYFGLTVCDEVVKVRERAMSQPWGEGRQRHSWQRHCSFVVARKGGC